MTTEATKTDIGSYFISNYPPFSLWTEDQLGEVRAAMNAPPADVPLGLYLHIPFCRKRCKFCYFRVYTDKTAPEIEQYVSALSTEIELVSKLPVMGDRPFRFVYFGGGTPSFLGVKQLRSLVDRLRANINWDRAEEVTFECEPGTLSEPKVHALKDLGITRLSLGIENFNDEILSENGRAHLSQEVYRAWDWIKAAEFPNVNIDLISGMVGESWDNWKDNIRRTVELSPDSVTIYQMELPFNTVYSRDALGNQVEVAVADWPTKRAWVDYAFEQLEESGYSVSSAYTMVKDSAKVNFSYRDHLWGGSDLLATGVASFGHVSGVHYQNHPDWAAYVGSLDKGELPLSRALRPTEHQLLIREMILQLKRGYLCRDYFRDKYSVDILDNWREIWTQYEKQGLVRLEGDRIETTRTGLLRVRCVASRLLRSGTPGSPLYMSGELAFLMGKFEARFPTDRQYAKNHMWAQPVENGYRVGFTAYAVRLLQDVYFLDWCVDAPAQMNEHQLLGAIESSKAESDLFCPMTGTLAKFNESLLSDPSTINVDKYQRGWLFEMQAAGVELLKPQEYIDHLAEVWPLAQRTIKGQLNE